MNPTTIRNTCLGLAAIAATLGLSCNPASAQATITAYYDFEGADINDPDTYDDPAGATADDLLGLYKPALSAEVTGNARGSAQAASFDGDSKLRTDAYSADLGPDPDAYTIMFWIKASDIEQENNNTRLMNVRKTPGNVNSTQPAWQVEGFGNNGSSGTLMDLRFAGLFTPDAMDGSIGALANTGQEEVWHHVAYVVANSGHPDLSGNAYSATYFDGVRTGLETESAFNGLPVGNTNGMLMIGGDESLTNGSRDFIGLLDDVALFAGVVSGDAIAAIASGVLSPMDDVSTASPLTLTRSGSVVLDHDEAEVTADLNADADVTIYFGTSDPGTTTIGWSEAPVVLGAQAAGNLFTTLTGLSETTTYFVRFFADDGGGNTAWSQARSFTTPLEFPPPILDAVLIADFLSPEAFVEVILEQADDADVTLVWDSSDKGTGSPGDWTHSVALGNFLFEETVPGTITGLGSNEPVFFRFFATNSYGSDWSELGSFTTPRDTPVLTAYYDFEGTGDDRYDDPAGEFADDLVGNNNEIFTSDRPANAKGSLQAAEFPASPNTANLRTPVFTTDLAPDPNAWTLMFWMKALPGDQLSGNTKNMGTRQDDTDSRAWRFDNWGGTNDDPNFIYDKKPNPLSTTWARRATDVASGTWRHVAFVNSNLASPDDGGAYLEIFVDGTSQGRTNMDDSWTAFDISSNGKLTIGNMEGTTGVYVGSYDDVALFAGIVPAADIAAIAGGSKSPGDFLPVTPGGELKITSLTPSGTDLLVGFTGEANTDYKMTESGDIVSGFLDTVPLVETTTDGSGVGMMTWPVSGSANYGRVEEK